MSDIRKAQDDLTSEVMGKPGVTGTAIGERAGKPCLKIYVKDPETGRKMPKSFGGFPVDVEVTGTFRRL